MDPSEHIDELRDKWALTMAQPKSKLSAFERLRMIFAQSVLKNGGAYSILKHDGQPFLFLFLRWYSGHEVLPDNRDNPDLRGVSTVQPLEAILSSGDGYPAEKVTALAVEEPVDVSIMQLAGSFTNFRGSLRVWEIKTSDVYQAFDLEKSHQGPFD